MGLVCPYTDNFFVWCLYNCLWKDFLQALREVFFSFSFYWQQCLVLQSIICMVIHTETLNRVIPVCSWIVGGLISHPVTIWLLKSRIRFDTAILTASDSRSLIVTTTDEYCLIVIPISLPPWENIYVYFTKFLPIMYRVLFNFVLIFDNFWFARRKFNSLACFYTPFVAQ